MPKHQHNTFATVRFVNVWECEKCGFKTKSETGLKVHSKYVHNNSKKPIFSCCPKCPKEFNTNKELKKHVQKHVIHIKGKRW